MDFFPFCPAQRTRLTITTEFYVCRYNIIMTSAEKKWEASTFVDLVVRKKKVKKGGDNFF